jgi:hypothetical protein
MATYIKGVTDQIPNSVPFQANYKMISDTLSNLQQRYNKGFDQVKSMYSSLINDPLSSSDNEQFRQEYLKKADAQLAKLSGVDFANQSNVVAAKSLFGPLVNDKQYVTDLYKTKRQNSEIQKMLQTKNSTDEKMRSQYSPIMEEYLMLGKKRLSETKRDDGSIESAAVHSYSPWQDPIEYASKLAKDQGLKFERNQLSGMYIIHTKNGEQSVGTYRNWYENTIGDKFDNQYMIEAEVKNERNIQSEMKNNPNLTRDQVVDKLANDFSTRYTELYNDQINDLEGSANEIDRQMRKLMNKYRGKFPPQYKQTIDAYAKQKSYINDTLAKLKKDKGTDAEFTKKAIDLYKGNPAATYVSEIKNNYAKRFAEKQAYGDTEVEYKPNQVALTQYQEQQAWARQQSSQSFEWKKFVAGKQWEQKKMEVEHAWDLEKMKLEGKIKGTGMDSGATVGNPEVVGAQSASYVYREQVADTYDKSYNAFINTNLLAVAAGMASNVKNKMIVQDQSDVNLSVVSQAISNKFKGQALNQDQTAALGKYLAKVSPGFKYNNETSTGTVLGIINGGFKFHKSDAGELADNLSTSLSESREAYMNLDKLQASSSKQLETMWRSRADYRENEYIIRSLNPTTNTYSYAVNYDKLDKMDAEDKEPIFNNLIPGYSNYQDKSNATRSTIVLNPSEPDKFDQTIHANAINDAEFFGVTNNEGEFEKFDDDDLGKFKNMVIGGNLMKQTLDPTNTTYALKVVNGNKYVKVTIPVKLNNEGESMAEKLSLPNGSEISEVNKVEFYVPMIKALRLGGNDVLYNDPISGETQRIPNDLKKQIYKLVQGPLIEEQTSWVTSGGLAEKGESVLPLPYNSIIDGGKLMQGTDDAIYMEFYSDGKMRTMNLTEQMNVPIKFSQYQNNPEKYDDQIQQFVEKYMQHVDTQTIKNGKAALNTSIITSQNNSDWIDWDKVTYSFGHN